jgi:6-phosphogluconolactonase
VHRICGELDAYKAAAEYERELVRSFGAREVPRFDVVLLGMGADGHTASLFAGSSALGESRAFVTSTFVEKLAAQRITLTLRTINAAHGVMFLVAGADKAETLRTVFLGGAQAQRLPVQRVKPWDGSVTWLVDRAAVARLASD